MISKEVFTVWIMPNRSHNFRSSSFIVFVIITFQWLYYYFCACITNHWWSLLALSFLPRDEYLETFLPLKHYDRKLGPIWRSESSPAFMCVQVVVAIGHFCFLPFCQFFNNCILKKTECMFVTYLHLNVNNILQELVNIQNNFCINVFERLEFGSS